MGGAVFGPATAELMVNCPSFSVAIKSTVKARSFFGAAVPS